MSESIEVTAVLLSWRRPYHIPRIAEHLRSFPQIKQVIVMCNEFKPTDEIKALYQADPKIADVVWSDQNSCTLGRFYAASQATYEAVLVCDDDLLVNNVPTLLAEYDGSQIIANLADDYSSRHWQFWQHDPKPYVELGFGSIFPRDWARRFMHMDWTSDQELKNRKADKAFTCLFPWKAIRAGTADITRLIYQGAESGKDANALYKRDDHALLTKRATDAAMQYKSTPVPLP